MTEEQLKELTEWLKVQILKREKCSNINDEFVMWTHQHKIEALNEVLDKIKEIVGGNCD